jgi:hypothetical protein
MNILAQPALYEIKIKGHLDARWSTWFGDMTVTTVDDYTIISGWVADQAALHGLLGRICDLGLLLISVTREKEKSV